METKNSAINREIGRQLKREKAVSAYSVRELAERTGISESVINMMWSKNPRDINITQITWLAALLDTTPQKIVEAALDKVGGLETVMAELREQLAMSAAADTTDVLRTRRLQKEAEQMSVAEIEGIAIAATKDAERRTDESPSP